MTTYSPTRTLFDTVVPLSVPINRIGAHRCRSRCLSFVPEFVLEGGAGVGAELVPGTPIATCVGAGAKREESHAQRSACCRAGKIKRAQDLHAVARATPSARMNECPAPPLLPSYIYRVPSWGDRVFLRDPVRSCSPSHPSESSLKANTEHTRVPL